MNVVNYFLFTQPWRKLLLHVMDWLPDKWADRLADAMYPDDMEVGFDETK